MSDDEYLQQILLCSDCGKLEPIDRWDIAGAADEMSDNVLFCRHCSNWVERPRRVEQKRLFAELGE